MDANRNESTINTFFALVRTGLWENWDDFQVSGFTFHGSFVHYYVDDLNKLPEIIHRLKDAASETSLVSKKNIEVLADTLSESATTINELLSRKEVRK